VFLFESVKEVIEGDITGAVAVELIESSLYTVLIHYCVCVCVFVVNLNECV